MPSLPSLAAAALLLLASGINAHFTVQYPATIGEFDEETEGDAPCGGITPDLADLDAGDFHVGGDSIATKSGHPQTDWLYRITTDPSAAGNWTELYPIVRQSGAGDYCTAQVTVPEEYVGQKAILSIVGSALDGLLYQCAAVNFVSETGSVPETCTNQTGTDMGSFADNDALSALVDEDSSTGTPSGSGSTSSETPTQTPNAGISMKPGSMEGFGVLVTVGFMVVVGATLMV